MLSEGASDASSDSSNTYWDLATCAAAVAAYVTENPSEMAMDNQIAVTPVPFEVQEATGRQWVEASLRDPWRCYENFREYTKIMVSFNLFVVFIHTSQIQLNCNPFRIYPSRKKSAGFL